MNGYYSFPSNSISLFCRNPLGFVRFTSQTHLSDYLRYVP